MKGTWKTDDPAPSGAGLLLVIAVVIAAASGAAAALATAVVVLLIAAGALVVLSAAGLAVFLAYRARHPVPLSRGFVPSPVLHRLPGGERPAVAPPAHLHIHLHGGDEDAAARIIRQAVTGAAETEETRRFGAGGGQ